MTSTPFRSPTSPWHRGRAVGRHLPVAVVGLLVGLLMLSTAVAAAAHPFVRGGGELPVDSLATMELDLAHGCGSEATGSGQDTLEVALEVPEWLRVVEIVDHPGYRHDVEVEQDRIVVVTWRADGAPVPAPVLELDVVASGTPGEPLFLAVFQGCADSAHRWIGTPSAPADDPAINVRLVAADPERPAPPPAPISDPGDGVAAEEPPSDDPGSDAPVEPDDAAPAPPDEPTEAAPVEPGVTGDQRGDLAGVLTWTAVVLAVLLGAGLLVLVLPGRRRADR